jgi:hypothetical protein
MFFFSTKALMVFYTTDREAMMNGRQGERSDWELRLGPFHFGNCTCDKHLKRQRQ